MSELEAHPIADIFPSMTAHDYLRLEHSIKEKGLLEPIWLYEGKILDGRHRYKACRETSTEPRFQTFEGSSEEALSFSIAMNHSRRHMTTEQKAALGVSIKEYESEKARERHEELAGRPKENSGNFSTVSQTGKARDLAGDKVGVSGRTIDDAERIAGDAPDVFERMKRGEYGSMSDAKRMAKLPRATRDRLHKRMDEGRDVELKKLDRDRSPPKREPRASAADHEEFTLRSLSIGFDILDVLVYGESLTTSEVMDICDVSRSTASRYMRYVEARFDLHVERKETRTNGPAVKVWSWPHPPKVFAE